MLQHVEPGQSFTLTRLKPREDLLQLRKFLIMRGREAGHGSPCRFESSSFAAARISLVSWRSRKPRLSLSIHTRDSTTRAAQDLQYSKCSRMKPSSSRPIAWSSMISSSTHLQTSIPPSFQILSRRKGSEVRAMSAYGLRFYG